jgi:sulfatase maturation enzyme AslB (radical SAM superfamily)
MVLSNRLVRSSFLVRVARDDGEATVFHALHGTSLVLNDAAEAVLDLFTTPTLVAHAEATVAGNLLPLVETFVSRRFLVDADLDERDAFVGQMRPATRAPGAHLGDLVLLVAETCNLACPYCIKDRLMELRPGRRQTRMAMDDACRAVDAFIAVAERAGRRDVGLQFRGGEALLNVDVVRVATRRMRARWTRGSVYASMVSNATLATDDLARELAELGIAVEVSIDGPREIHDAIRYAKDGRPTYDRVLTGLGRLVRAGVIVPNINATVTAETLPAIDASFLAEMAHLGVKYLNLEPDVLRPAHPDPQVLAQALLRLRELGQVHGIEVSGCWGRALRAIEAVGQGASQPPLADFPLLVVDALGQVVPWEYNAVGEFGPVVDLETVLASEAYQRHASARAPGCIPECVGCEVEGLCQGNASMTLVYERATGRSGVFAHRCELIRAMTRGVLARAAAAPPSSGRRGPAARKHRPSLTAGGEHEDPARAV